MSRLLYYVHEMDEYVGPFVTLGDAELFLALMADAGDSLEGIEIVEIDGDANLAPHAVSVDERKQLLDKVKRSPRLPRESG